MYRLTLELTCGLSEAQRRRIGPRRVVLDAGVQTDSAEPPPSQPAVARRPSPPAQLLVGVGLGYCALADASGGGRQVFRPLARVAPGTAVSAAVQLRVRSGSPGHLRGEDRGELLSALGCAREGGADARPPSLHASGAAPDGAGAPSGLLPPPALVRLDCYTGNPRIEEVRLVLLAGETAEPAGTGATANPAGGAKAAAAAGPARAPAPTQPTSGPADVRAGATSVCVLGAPTFLVAADLVRFLGHFASAAVHLRLCRAEADGGAGRSVALVRFADAHTARAFRAERDGACFSSLEPETARVLPVRALAAAAERGTETTAAAAVATAAVDIGVGALSSTSAPPDAPSAAEPEPPSPAAGGALGGAGGGGGAESALPPGAPLLRGDSPACAVCLEPIALPLAACGRARLPDAEAIFTTTCNHSFHLGCITRWARVSDGCPLCRYGEHGGTGSSNCFECGSAEHNLICVVCGHIGCLRPRGAGARAGAGSAGAAADAAGSVAADGAAPDAGGASAAHVQPQPPALPPGGASGSRTRPPSPAGGGDGHARAHYERCAHRYAMEVGEAGSSSRVRRCWDYCARDYVDRLVLNKVDGTPVRVDKGRTGAEGGSAGEGGAGRHGAGQVGGACPASDAASASASASAGPAAAPLASASAVRPPGPAVAGAAGPLPPPGSREAGALDALSAASACAGAQADAPRARSRGASQGRARSAGPPLSALGAQRPPSAQASAQAQAAAEAEAYAQTAVELVVSEFSLVLASQLEAQRAFFQNLLSERADAAGAELAELRARTASARAELQRRAGEGGGEPAAAQLRARESEGAADEASLRALRQLHERLLAQQQADRAALEAALEAQAALGAQRADAEDQLRDLAVHVRAHGALAGEAVDGGLALPETRAAGAGRAGRHAGGRHAQAHRRAGP